MEVEMMYAMGLLPLVFQELLSAATSQQFQWNYGNGELKTILDSYVLSQKMLLNCV